MGSRHRFAELGECLSLIIDHRGKTPKKLGSHWVKRGVPTLSAKNVSGGWLVAEDSIRHVTHDVYKRWMNNGDVQRGDCFLVSEGATLGECMYWDEDYPVVLGQRLFCLRANPKVLYSRYLYFYMTSHSFQSEVAARATGTSVPGLRQTEVLKLRIRLPPIEEQRVIGDTLYSLNKKIKLNRQMNETLEAMARAVFKSWFVDFDPARAKAEGRDPGLPKPFSDQFPDSFEDSELGDIPKGWAVSPLRDLAGYLSRGIGPAYVNVGGVYVLNQKCVRDRRVDFSRARRHDPSKKSIVGRTLRVLDILVNSTGVGTLGRIAQLWDLPESAIVDSHVTVIRAAEGVDPWFLGIALIGRETDVEALGEGSTGQTELSRTRLGELTCLVPPTDLQASFGHLVGPLLSRLSANERVAITLATLRDTLLPKLVSGELRVAL